MTEDKTETNKASWNFSADHSKLVFKQLEDSQKHKRENNIGACFDSLVELFDLIEFNVEETVARDMDRKISIVSRRKKYWDKYNSRHDGGATKGWTREDEKERKNFIYGTRRILRLILRLLKKAGYLTNKIDDSNLGL